MIPGQRVVLLVQAVLESARENLAHLPEGRAALQAIYANVRHLIVGTSRPAAA